MSLTSPSLVASAKTDHTMTPTTTLSMDMNASMDMNSAPPQAQQQGNLETVLTQFDHSHNSPHQSPHHQPQTPPSSLTINIPGGGSTNNHQDDDGDMDDRERSLTLGSEFDLGWILGKDGRGMSMSGLLTPMGAEPAVDGGMSSEGTSTTVVSGSPSSSHNPTQIVAGGAPIVGAHDDIDAATATFAATFLPRLPEDATVSQSAEPININIMLPIETTSGQQQGIPARERADSTASQFFNVLTLGRERGDSTASSFLNGLYQQQSVLPQETRSQSSIMIAHTPPTQMGTSYENSHFGKRMRAGSISGRLRSASDLEDTGIISHEQKAILKDLIIAGDNSVQGAIDKYEDGDPSALEDMIKSGALLARSSDVDLLGDLDLDFLNVHGGEGDDDDGMMFGNMDDIGGGENDGRQRGGNDGIGDLEFNGDFSNPAMEPRQVASNSNYYQMSQHPPMGVHRKSRGNSIDDLEVHRMRANSLALPGFLLDGSNPDDVAQISFGRWMDKNIAGGGGAPLPHAMQILQGAPIQRQFAPNSRDANGNRTNLNPSQVSSECDVLMASKSRGGNSSATTTSPQGRKPKAKKERTKKAPAPKKDKKEPRERKSQSRMKDMMESITSNNNVSIGDDGENKEAPSSGQGRPRSMSDPNLSVGIDNHGLLHVNGPEGWVGAYSPNSRQLRIHRFLEKRNHRVWVKKVKYDVRKNLADSRLRVKGRFVKKDEMLMRELMSLT
mmetsp:Transcript_23441/g.38293  ORF Transcript_23441/g.38293 Transcript_23441/m.38293 type:complete len:727 (-) Transcript_23441:689-2869(-)